ncbi:FadR/GntR family transcriptional regulator [Streptomyces pathocidini]|uniref:FadR/GntR family transcriptional regulator n=1 Tax=Streptomyces pathocidini TaxID=1650571 RepID=A0ABW7UTC3_9ACTN|nr:FCD domain-containing protein [Streptomyces pathocidini]
MPETAVPQAEHREQTGPAEHGEQTESGERAESGDGYRPGYEVTAERILEFIAARGLRPGDRLPTEVRLAQELDVSRSVTREAIKILSALGRVRAHRGRGLFVADEPGLLAPRKTDPVFFMPTDLNHIMLVFEYRGIQETEISRLAAERATPAELRAIGEAVDRYREGAARADSALFGPADEDFHLAVATAAHNPFLTQAVQKARQLLAQSTVIGLGGRTIDRVAAAAVEHAAIYEAIRAGRPEAAARAAAEHIDNSLEDYRKAVRQRLFG